jgi:hypothetical protein
MVSVILMDTEGLGSSERTGTVMLLFVFCWVCVCMFTYFCFLSVLKETHDTQVMALALLFSTVFVYNSMGSIDDSAVERLGVCFYFMWFGFRVSY